MMSSFPPLNSKMVSLVEARAWKHSSGEGTVEPAACSVFHKPLLGRVFPQRIKRQSEKQVLCHS